MKERPDRWEPLQQAGGIQAQAALAGFKLTAA